MALCINQSGTYRNITCGSGRINQSGTYRKFIGAQLLLGDTTGGGIMICAAGGTRWIVSPSDAQVSRNWYDKEDSNTRAQQVSGVGGWFIPTLSQFQNPGVQCLGYWDGYSNPEEHNRSYWTSTEDNPASAKDADITHGLSGNTGKQQTRYVRAFRTVSY